jgi:ABC-2 type transport system ATP-binding protein
MIEVEKLTKHYRVAKRKPGLRAALRSILRRDYELVRAVNEISFRIEPGARVGFLGPNGAGKTTTLKMLSGLLHPTSGKALVNGHTPARRSAEFLGGITLVMGQKQQLIWDLPPAETFELNRAIYGVPQAEFSKTLAELTELLAIGPLVGKPTRQLSLGERMRCELVAALLHRPRVLFLDEPTIGLDVAMQLAVREFIRAYNERHGATVLLTSHYMQDVLALCPRVIIIDGGVLRYDGDLHSLVRSVRPGKRVAARIPADIDRAALERLGKVVELSPEKATLDVSPEELRAAVSFLLERGASDLTIEDPPLEEAMREIFKEKPDPPDRRPAGPAGARP